MDYIEKDLYMIMSSALLAVVDFRAFDLYISETLAHWLYGTKVTRKKTPESDIPTKTQFSSRRPFL